VKSTSTRGKAIQPCLEHERVQEENKRHRPERHIRVRKNREIIQARKRGVCPVNDDLSMAKHEGLREEFNPEYGPGLITGCQCKDQIRGDKRGKSGKTRRKPSILTGKELRRFVPPLEAVQVSHRSLIMRGACVVKLLDCSRKRAPRSEKHRQ